MKVWKLFKKSTHLGTLKEVSVDQPWFSCNFIPNPEFDNHKTFFSNLSKEYSSGEIDDFDDFFSQIKRNEYSLTEGERISVRFILLFDQESGLVRLRST